MVESFCFLAILSISRYFRPLIAHSMTDRRGCRRCRLIAIRGAIRRGVCMKSPRITVITDCVTDSAPIFMRG
jgi:hypothetical protein